MPILRLRGRAWWPPSGVKATMLTRSERTQMAADKPDLKRTLEALELLADALTTPGINATPEWEEPDDDEDQQQSEGSDPKRA